MTHLKDILKEANITQLDIANELNIRSLSTVNQKINNKSDFTVIEADGVDFRCDCGPLYEVSNS